MLCLIDCIVFIIKNDNKNLHTLNARLTHLLLLSLNLLDSFAKPSASSWLKNCSACNCICRFEPASAATPSKKLENGGS